MIKKKKEPNVDTTPKAKAAKVRTDKLDDLKIKSFCTSKDTISRLKSQPTEWEKAFVNHASDKGLLSKIQMCKKLVQQQQKTTWFKNGQRT